MNFNELVTRTQILVEETGDGIFLGYDKQGMGRRLLHLLAVCHSNGIDVLAEASNEIKMLEASQRGRRSARH